MSVSLKHLTSCNNIDVVARIVLVAVLTALCGTSYGQYTSTAHDARSGAMGGCFMADDTLRRVSVSYSQPYLLADMADKGVSVVWPTSRIGTFGAIYRHHGGASYHEQTAVVGYGIQVASWLKAGVAAHYMHVGTDDAYYEAQQWLGASAALQAAVGSRVCVTMVAGTQPWVENSPWRMHVQMAYRPMTQMLTVVGFEKEERMRVRMGMEYDYRGALFFRAGVTTNPMTATFGIGVRMCRLTVDIGAAVHRVLGITPQTTLTLWL